MKLIKHEDMILQGYGTIRAWERGVIPELFYQGYPLAEIRNIIMPVYENTVHNLIVSVGKFMVGDWAIDVEATGLTYHAFGTGTTAPALNDTTLTTESERKLWTTRSRASNVITLSVFYAAAQCTYNIKECGIFGGASAGAGADSGVLFSHYLQAYDNSGGGNDLTFDYNLTIG